jgi:hypothetical protein
LATQQDWVLHDWDKVAPPQVASPPQEAPVQVLVWVPPPQETEQALQPLKVPLTGGLLVEQATVPPPQEPTQFQLLVQAPSAVSEKVPLLQVLVVLPQTGGTGLLVLVQ